MWICGYGSIMSTELLIRIQSDPARCGGRPCIRDTRMRVTDVLELFAAGASRAEILADFPYLEDEDLSAALAYAARLSEVTG